MKRGLRIALFVHEFPALSETFVLNQIVGLIELDCDVTIFANARRPDTVEHADIGRHRLGARTCYLAMPEGRLRRVIEAVHLIRQYRRRWPRLIHRSLNVFRYGRDALSLKLLFWTIRIAERDSRFDVLYCHFGPIGRTATFLREIGVIDGPLATAFHGVDVSAVLRRAPHFYQALFDRGDLFFPVSRHWEMRLQAHGCDPDRTTVHHMGVDLERFRFRRRHRLPGAPVRLLSIGRLVEKKGIEYALRAVALARERGIRLYYTIVGDGPLRTSLIALADELGLRDTVVFAGWADQGGILGHIYASDVLLAPSITDRMGDQEGIPVAIMEAMATGLPVVATRHSGIPELVHDRKSGLLVAEADAEELAAAIAWLCMDQELRERMGVEGRRVIETGFDIRALNGRLCRLFTELATGSVTMLGKADGTGASASPRSLPLPMEHAPSGAAGTGGHR
jgi:colanic acid/amylovoran biosynthesis glycosyltransferase